jgi:hypothetical protein
MKKLQTHLTWLSTAFILLCGAGCGMDDDAGYQNHNNVDGGYPDGNLVDHCELALLFDPADPVTGQTLQTHLQVMYGTPINPAWTVQDPDGVAVTHYLRNGDMTAEFIPTIAGTYTVKMEAELAEDPTVACTVADHITVATANGHSQELVLRLTPPDPSTAPRQDKHLTVFGATPQTNLELHLAAGRQVSLSVDDPDGQSIPAYLRLTPVAHDLVIDRYYNPSANTVDLRVADGASYDILVVPDLEPDIVAPQLFLDLTADDMALLALEEGIVVSGSVVDESAQGIAGARVVLRCNGVPSTVASTSVGTGGFSLLAREGQCTAHFRPPAGSARPSLKVSADANVIVAPSTETELVAAYHPLALRTFSATVKDTADAPLANARVTLSNETDSAAGQITVLYGGVEQQTIDATGTVQKTIVTDSGGSWSTPVELPAGLYTVLIEPNDGQTATLTTVDLTTADATDVTLQLAPAALVSGTVWHRTTADALVPSPNVRVVATTNLGMGGSVETTTDASGHFSLATVEGARYQLKLIPAATAGLARRVDLTFVAQDGLILGAAGEKIILPRGLSLSGTLSGAGSGADVLIQVFEGQDGSAAPVCQTVTDAAGAFRLTVPDPGVEEDNP